MRQPIATRVPPPPDLLELGSVNDMSEFDDYTITSSPSSRPISNESTLSRHSKRYNTVFSEDEDDAPMALNGGQPNYTSKFSSLIPPSMRSNGYMDPMLSSPSYHVFLAENALITLKHIVKDDGWKKALKHKSGVVVHMKSGLSKEDKTPIFKGQAVIHGFSPQSIFYVVGMRKLWDESYEDGNLVENLNETTSLTYEVGKATATSKPRDLALVEKIECSQDGSIYFACTSVESARIPRVPGRTRATIKARIQQLLQGWILEPVRGPTQATRVTYVIQESTKGWMSGFAKKSLARRPLVIALVNDYLQRKSERMRTQKKGTHLSAANTRQHPSLNASSTLNAHSLHQQMRQHQQPQQLQPQQQQQQQQQQQYLNPYQSGSMRSTNSSIRPASPAESIDSQVTPEPSPTSSQRSILLPTPVNTNLHAKRRITFADHDTTYSAESAAESPISAVSDNNSDVYNTHSKSNGPRSPVKSPTVIPTRHLYPSHRHVTEKAESLKLLKQLASSLDGWTSRGTQAGIETYVRMQQGEPTFLRGDGVVEGGWTAEQLCSVVHCFGARKIWDERFDEGRVVERFSQKDYLVQWRLRSLFPVAECDVAAITSIETDPSQGVVYTATTSVVDSQLPPSPDETVRAETPLYGWAFRPVQDEHGRTHSVRVTLICHMDYKVSLPVKAAKVLGDEMLACVANVRDYMEQYGCPPYIRRVAGKVLAEEFDAISAKYSITYIAKHEPSSAYRSSKKAASWCTDIRFTRAVYPHGLEVKVSPTQGTRIEMASDRRSVRIYTTRSDMEGSKVVVLLAPEQEKPAKKAEKAVLPTAMMTASAVTESASTTSAAAPVADSAVEDISPADAVSGDPGVPTTPVPSSNRAISRQDPPKEPATAAPSVNTAESATDKVTDTTDNATARTKEKTPPPTPLAMPGSNHAFAEPRHSSPHPLHSHAHPLTDSTVPPFSPMAASHVSTNSLQVPKGYMLVPQNYQNNNIIIISDELTFNGQQLAVVFIAMVLCYYAGKFACAC
ncbi:hypothetical protein BCR43DRAFT_526075 [Syncephalastrum racemosum]|uniref:START domain-containing protein n=1 Tax=Syncephalastrum racemosum TaxID=13706 RepID=A0A1X2H8S1_SYNRA|nr:hypothetical protein BCR43DRAFT_526075 [Syncephalastrum racemosum]